MSGLESEKLRRDFPVLNRSVRGKKLVYFDNAASAQKPQCVIQAVSDFYAKDYSNIHRGVHFLSETATQAFEKVRDKVKDFISAQNREEIIFVKGTTEAVNLVAQSFVRPQLKPADEILISTMEHHANIVPWQLLCAQTGAVLKVMPITDQGEIIFDEFLRLLNSKTKFVSVIHISNSLGTINPIEKIIQAAHDRSVPVMIDGAQGAVHQKINLQTLKCDFYAFSGHKLYGPTGIGVLYGKRELLEKMPPYQGGGEMISRVSFEKTTYNNLPYKFEAGTPNIAGVIGLGAAIDYLSLLDFDKIYNYEKSLLNYAEEKIKIYPEIKIIGTAAEKAPILSFVFEHIHAHDAGTILDQEGIAVRTGHHCTMPLMQRLKLSATIRASFAFYNTVEEIDYFINALGKVKQVFT